MVELLQSATAVVVAEVADVGSDGEVVLRPTAVLVGSLPTDAEGLYRFPAAPPASTGVGLWAFDEQGLPVWSDRADDVMAPPFPWAMPHSTNVVHEAFPELVRAEALRVLGEADLLVGLRSVDAEGATPSGGETLLVVRVISGDGGVEPGTELSLRYFETSQQMVGRGLADEAAWALQRVGDGWVTVPTWLPAAWDCNEATVLTFWEAFPEVQLEHHSPAGCSFG